MYISSDRTFLIFFVCYYMSQNCHQYGLDPNCSQNQINDLLNKCTSLNINPGNCYLNNVNYQQQLQSECKLYKLPDERYPCSYSGINSLKALCYAHGITDFTNCNSARIDYIQQQNDQKDQLTTAQQQLMNNYLNTQAKNQTLNQMLQRLVTPDYTVNVGENATGNTILIQAPNAPKLNFFQRYKYVIAAISILVILFLFVGIIFVFI